MGVNSLPKTVTQQHRGCDLNPGPSAPESSTLTTRLPSHPRSEYINILLGCSTCTESKDAACYQCSVVSNVLACVHRLDITMTCAKTGEPIEQPFGVGPSVDPSNHVLGEDPDSPRGRGNFDLSSHLGWGLRWTRVTMY